MANLPTAPRTWTDGEDPENIPSADDLDLDWRDNFNFLLGYTRPFIFLESTVAQALGTNVYVVQNWQTEFVKRGDMVHAVNGSGITVPITGQYQGWAIAALDTISTLTTRISLQILKNGTQAAVDNSRPEVVTGHQMPISFTLDLAANDVVTMATRSSSSTASTMTAALSRPRIALWYIGDFS